MIRTVFFILLGSALVAFPMLYLRQPAGAYALPGVVHLGSIDPDSAEFVESEFTLVNKTSTEMGLVNLITSCVCSSVDADKRLIAPGDSARISVKIRTKNMRGHRWIPIQVYTDHLEYPHFELVTTCDFTTSGTISPLDINMPPVVALQDFEWSFQVPLAEVAIQDLKADGLPAWLKLKPENLPGGKAQLNFVGVAPEVAGNYDFNLQAKFEGGADWTPIAAHLKVIDRYEVPQGLNLGIVELGKKLEAKFRIADRLGVPFEVAGVKMSTAAISTKNTPIEKSLHEVSVDFLPDQIEGPGASELTCEIVAADSTRPMVVSIPVQYRLLPN